MRSVTPRVRLALAGSTLILLIAVIVAAIDSGGPSQPKLQGTSLHAPSGDPFVYRASAEASFETRATAGSAHVLFAKSPGGALATAARVAAFRSQIDSATAGPGVDPATIEGNVD